MKYFSAGMVFMGGMGCFLFLVLRDHPVLALVALYLACVVVEMVLKG